jgi:phenylacetic acid degradation operon negative regulatory protein
MDAPSPRSLILDLLSTLRRGSMPVGALVAAGELFGLAPGTLRVALARLLAAGRVERDSRGRYQLGEKAAPIQRAVVSWRHLDRLTVEWDGSWWAVHAPRPPGRGERRRHEQALRLLGFRELSPGLRVRPANLAGG